MKQEIKERIERIRKGEVPEGFKMSYIKECCEILDNQRVPIKDSERILGNVPYYGATGIQGYVDNYIFDEDLLLVGEDGADWSSFGKTAYIIRGKSWVNNHAHVLRAIQINLYYLKEYLILSDLRKYVNGSTRGKLNLNALGKIPLLHPEYAEQSKIAEILSTWDKAIELKEKLIEEKKEFKMGLVQKLITGEMRFPEFNGNWKKVVIGDIFEEVKRINDNISMDIDILTISAKNGFLSQKDKFSKVIAGSSLDKYTHLLKNEFAYNKGNSKTAPFGCIFKLDMKEGLVPFVYICFRPTQMIDIDFFDFYFKHGLLDRQLKRIITSGARSDGLLNVSKDNFFNIKISLPSIEEQKKIGLVLRLIQTEIDYLIDELNQLKEQKRGLMQLLLTGIVRVEVD